MKNNKSKNKIKYSTIKGFFDSNLDDKNIRIFKMINDNLKKKSKKISISIPKEIAEYNWIFIVGIRKWN